MLGLFGVIFGLGGCSNYDRTRISGSEVSDTESGGNQGYGCGTGGTHPVGTHPAGVSHVGAHDTVGNVRELTSDCWHDDYTGAWSNGLAYMADCDSTAHVVARGCGFSDPQEFCNGVMRWPQHVMEQRADVGGRCVVTYHGQ